MALLGSRGIPAKYGAFEVAAEKVAEGLLARGWQPTVFCPSYQEYRAHEYKGIRLRFVWHPPGGLGSLTYDGLSLVAACRGYDAILMFGYGGSPFLAIPRLFDVPVVVNTDGLEWRRSKWSRPVKTYFKVAERIVSRLATRLISDARGIQQYYRERYGVDSEYIAYGTELPEPSSFDVRELGLEPGDYYIVVMRLEPENSIREIVQGYLASRTPKKLVIVGPSTPYFDAEVRPLFMQQERVKYLGPIYERDRVFALRQSAFAYVHGHTVGGTNPSLLEAMASENFVVAKDVEFNREVVGDAGRYFASASELSHVIDDLENSAPGAVRTAGRQGRQIIEERFRWEQVVDAYARVIEEAMESGRVG